jgi:hypothetical protein
MQHDIGVLTPIIELWDMDLHKRIINSQRVEAELAVQHAFTVLDRLLTQVEPDESCLILQCSFKTFFSAALQVSIPVTIEITDHAALLAAALSQASTMLL